jgi:hypothetical protein
MQPLGGCRARMAAFSAAIAKRASIYQRGFVAGGPHVCRRKKVAAALLGSGMGNTVTVSAPRPRLRSGRNSALPNVLNFCDFSNGYGGPDSRFESCSLRHELSI